MNNLLLPYQYKEGDFLNLTPGPSPARDISLKLETVWLERGCLLRGAGAPLGGLLSLTYGAFKSGEAIWNK
jgi:hypothetical protein